MKSWLFITVSILIVLVLLNNGPSVREISIDEKIDSNGLLIRLLLGKLPNGSRLVLKERFIYETELTIESDKIDRETLKISSGHDSDKKSHNQIGLKYAKTVAIYVVHIPPIVKKKFDARVTVRDLRVSFADISLVNYQITAPNLLIFTMARGRLVLDGGYQVKIEFPPIKKHGSITVELNDISFTFSVQLLKNAQGILQAQLHQCSSSIGSIKIRVGNDIVKRVFNFYKGDFKKEANQRICPCLNQLINVANSMLLKQTSFYNLPGGLKFDYSLLSNPEEQGQFLNFELVGETVKGDGAHDTPFAPGPLTTTVDFPNRMSIAFVSEYVFNSFSYQATKTGLFNEIHLEKNDHIKSLLRLKCAEGEQCIGRFAVDMSKTFTDNTGELILRTEIYPQINISQQGAVLACNVSFELRFQRRSMQFQPDANPTVVLTFDLGAVANITSIAIRKLGQTQNNMTAKAHITSIFTSNVSPKVEEIKNFAKYLPFGIHFKAQSSLTQALGTGVVFSSPKSFSLDMDIAFRDRALVLGLDVMNTSVDGEDNIK